MKQVFYRTVVWVSAAILLFMMTPMNAIGIVSFGVLMIAVLLLVMQMPSTWDCIRRTGKGYSIFFALCCSFAAGMCFFDMWKESTLLGMIAQMIGLQGVVLPMILAFVGSLAATLSVSALLGYAYKLDCDEKEQITKKPVGLKELLVLLLCAICVITIGSKSSPIYPLNDWMDANCYFTVGKSMLHGKVLYRDIFEHKGLYMYILHTMAYLISNTTFFGVYVFEIVAAFAFLLIAYNTARLHSSESVIWLMPVFAAMVYTTGSFAHGGSAEEYCLPFLAYAMYVGLKSLRRECPLTMKEYFMIGLTSGCILWTKYTMLGYYVGWIIVPAYVTMRSSGFRTLVKALGMIVLGVMLASIPVIFYFGVNDAFGDLWEVYFFDNIFRYGAESKVAEDATLLQNLLAGLNTALIYNTFMFQSMIFGAGYLAVKRESKMVLFAVSSFIGLFLLTYSGGRPYMYYGMPFAVFSVMVLPEMNAIIVGFQRRFGKPIQAVLLACGIAILVLGNNNAYMLGMDQQELPQYQFAEVIESVEEPTLLNYGFLDGGFYTVCDIVPTCKYFCCTNVPLPEMMQVQNEYVQQGLTDFVVTRNTPGDFKLYDCVAQAVYYHEGENHTYYLYALKTLGLKCI